MSENLAMNEDEAIDVEVVDDRPEDDRVPERGDGSDAEDLDSEIRDVDQRVKKRINRLKYEYHEERRAKESADRMREEAVTSLQRMHQENSQLRDLVHQGESVLMQEMKARADGDADKAKHAYKAAYEEGDSDAIAEAQQQMVQATYDSQMAASMPPGSFSANIPQTNLPNTLQQQVGQQPQQPQQPQQTPKPDPQAVEWMGRNPWFGDDEEMTSFAYGVHEKLVLKDGVNPRSGDYYTRIDKRMREVFPEKFGGRKEDGESAASHRTNTVVAPASRSTGSRPRTVQLTATQVALAKRLGITPQQYAAQMLKESKNG